MSDGALSEVQFQSNEVETPLSLSASTTGSAAQATAWRNSNLGKGRPLAYSAKTRGTTYNFDSAPQPETPSSDKGAGRNDWCH